MKPWTVEQRFPTRAARERADAVTDAMSTHLPFYEHLDAWIAEYRAAGGVERRPGR